MAKVPLKIKWAVYINAGRAHSPRTCATKRTTLSLTKKNVARASEKCSTKFNTRHIPNYPLLKSPSPEGIVRPQTRAKRNISNANRANAMNVIVCRALRTRRIAPETNYHTHISTYEIDEKVIDVTQH